MQGWLWAEAVMGEGGQCRGRDSPHPWVLCLCRMAGHLGLWILWGPQRLLNRGAKTRGGGAVAEGWKR